MTNEQLYLAIGVPLGFNAVMFTIVFLYLNARFEGVKNQFESVKSQFDGVNKRFDDMRDLWRAELRRVEEVIDARLKHMEESK